ncbi:MAG: threonylcarbamoyl-AMP synthase [Deltaproteobacteria bacterium]|nr:threonylcarbamoyl-AMP synthase [Deltaproteobacteria bacterium]MBW2052238.1 threonylcarbamoyl-AMP synthase [Deltaproteobacteria bacterium]MBW2141690.1 threonylcarbamoyl-AMP synthase [Deltaproteobacteria bacterium]MBW2322055.1 threonylcarbamoyl-AMP synthase [Deltaproteobacteria bacterium]
MIIRINPNNPQLRLINRVIGVVRNGGVIAYPTDTNYGIGCNLYEKKAIEKIYRIKKRSQKKPFSFICADLKDISKYARVSNYAYKTMRRLLPGPYTFILDGTRLVPKVMLTPRKEAGIRIPNQKVCLYLVKALGNPIINTTASFNQGETFCEPEEIEDRFKGLIDLVVDGGPVPGEPSTVVSLIGDVPTIIREGLGDVSII